MLKPVLLQGSQHLFGLPFRTPAAVKPGAKRGDDAHEVTHQFVFSRSSGVDDHQFPSLHAKECLHGGHAKAGSSVLVSDDNLPDLGIRKPRQKLGTLIIDATATFFDDLADGPTDAALHQLSSRSACVSSLFLFSRPDTRAYPATVWTGSERSS